MRPFRRLGFALWIALSLLVGQQAAMLHGLGHAKAEISHPQDSKVPKPACDECYAFSQLASVIGASAPTLPHVASVHELAVFFRDLGNPTAARLAFRSRAPPVLL